MVNAKQIKTQIKSVGNIGQITKALEVVATVKLQKTKVHTENYKQFMIEFLKVVQVINTKYNIFNNPENKNPQKNLIIVTSTDRGLCGSLNNKLFKYIFNKYQNNKNKPDVFCIGRKALEFFSRANFTIAGQLSVNDTFQQDDLQELYIFIRNALESGEYNNIEIYFNYFENAIKQSPITLQLFPLDKESINTFGEQLNININQFLTKHIELKEVTLEPSITILAQEIKEQFIQHMVYGAILQNKTGEFSARMIAMKNAKDNSNNMIKDLKLSYNKARQGAVTQEISEIMGAKMALEK